MNNAFRVLGRDLRRFARVPQAIVILIGIIIIPSLYAWFNIIAFWDPYGDTKAVNVAIVNLDEGASSPLTGELNVGDQVVAQLKQNDQLGWQFLGLEEAMTDVRSGEAYAAIVLPPHFSSDLLSLTTGDFVRPELEYFVNEKANAIAPKITDVGASTLETQINATFVSTVAKTIAQTLEQTGNTIGDRLTTARDDSADALATALAQVADARAGLEAMGETLDAGAAAAGEAGGALDGAAAAVRDVQRALAETQSIVDDVRDGLLTFTDTVTTAYVSGTAQLTEISATLNQSLTGVLAKVSQANAVIGSGLADATAVVEANAAVLANLEEVREAFAPGDPEYDALTTAIENLQERNAADEALLADLRALNDDVTALTGDLQASADALNASIAQTATAAGAVKDALLQTVPGVNRAMSELSASAGAFASALDGQIVLIEQAADLLRALDEQLLDTRTVGASVDDNLAGVEAALGTVRTDVLALSSADLLNQVQALTGLDPDRIATFMASPVAVETKTLFPVATYGSAMAPLFTNLSLWIGAFVLVVLLKQEVDSQGIRNLTVREAYLGRWMLLAVINFFQALLVSIGNIVIGVQMANAAAFVATCVFVGFVYMALIYALAVSFGYVGKGVIILLVIMQIPGASGIYPIQMMPDFFQALFPFFPFTYGIDAMRETIGGFYHAEYWRSFAVLALYAVLAFVLGLFFRQRLGNFARLFNTKLSVTGLFVSENVEVLGSHRRVTQLVQALTDRKKFREKTQRQAEWFEKHHLTVLRLTLLGGVGITALLAVLAWVVPDAKATVLALWGVLCLLIIAVVVAFEYIKQNVGFAQSVGRLGDTELQSKLEQEELSTRSDAVLSTIRQRGDA